MTILQWAYQNRRALIWALALLVVLCIVGWFIWQKNADAEARLQQAVTMTNKQAEDINYLQNALGESKQNAEMLADAVKQAKAGQLQPVYNFTVQAPNVQQAAQDVAQRINKGDQTLPPSALEKTDRTVVVTNENKTPQANYDVGVFKVNNYRNWEWSGGYGRHGGDSYVPIEVQRNFSKDAALSYEQHIGGRQSGWEVKYTRKTDKLLILF